MSGNYRGNGHGGNRSNNGGGGGKRGPYRKTAQNLVVNNYNFYGNASSEAISAAVSRNQLPAIKTQSSFQSDGRGNTRTTVINNYNFHGNSASQYKSISSSYSHTNRALPSNEGVRIYEIENGGAKSSKIQCY